MCRKNRLFKLLSAGSLHNMYMLPKARYDKIKSTLKHRIRVGKFQCISSI